MGNTAGCLVDAQQMKVENGLENGFIDKVGEPICDTLLNWTKWKSVIEREKKLNEKSAVNLLPAYVNGWTTTVFEVPTRYDISENI